MKYTLVKPDGTLGNTLDFQATPPVLAPNKGRWVADMPPVYDSTYFEIAPVFPIGANALEIPYNVLPRSLATVKAEKLASLVNARKTAILNDVVVSGKAYPTDSEYREIISNLASRSARGKPLPSTLRGRDGLPVSLTPTLLGNIEDAITAQVQAAWDNFWVRYDQVMAATTVIEVGSIVW